MCVIGFRRVTRLDFPLLASWLCQPRIARWWNHDFSPEAIERDFGKWSWSWPASGDTVMLSVLVLGRGADCAEVETTVSAEVPS